MLELLVTLTILSILASAILPLSEMAVKRSRELELKRSLRLIRSAIDEYKKDFDLAAKRKFMIPALDETGYPETLEDLVRGTDWGGLYPFRKKYLRRVPEDPFDPYEEGWALRSYTDEPDSLFWDGRDVYDVYSRSEEVALDGTLYKTW